MGKVKGGGGLTLISPRGFLGNRPSRNPYGLTSSRCQNSVWTNNYDDLHDTLTHEECQVWGLVYTGVEVDDDVDSRDEDFGRDEYDNYSGE